MVNLSYNAFTPTAAASMSGRATNREVLRVRFLAYPMPSSIHDHVDHQLLAVEQICQSSQSTLASVSERFHRRQGLCLPGYF